MSEKQNIMDVYNALNDTDYDEDEDFEITTLEDVIYVHHKNDVSIMIDCALWLFEQPGYADLELTVTMINVNRGCNRELLGKSKVLTAFSIYNDKVRCYNKIMQKEKAVFLAIDECISEGVMPEFFRNRRSEVENMILTEFNEEKYEAALKNIAKEEGKAEGKAEDILDILSDLGEVPQELVDRIKGETDFDRLRVWLKLAAKSDSIEKFETGI